MIVQAIRSALFYVLFIGQTTVLAIFLGVIAIFKRGWFAFGVSVIKYWSRSNQFLMRWITGIRSEVTGIENLPDGPFIIAAKHQSDWDIFAILAQTRRPAFVAKKQLLDIPFFGQAARALDVISVDRKKGSQAMAQMVRGARDAIGRGCQIVIYPEGTRKAPLAPPDYRYGIVRLYSQLDVPVVPVALDSGLYWSRNSPVLWPGTARARFLAPIPPGLDPKVFQARLQETIENETDAMILEAVNAGLSRPIDPQFRARIDAASARTGN